MENDLSTGQDVDWKAMARLPQFKGQLTLKVYWLIIMTLTLSFPCRSYQPLPAVPVHRRREERHDEAGGEEGGCDGAHPAGLVRGQREEGEELHDPGERGTNR